ncbi:MAG TPA: hypothetical protein VF218_07545, partial [Acidothermaceae bacterium]
MHTLIARWSPARGVWETGQQAVCGHSALYSETWPTSGMTRDGVAYELPTSAHRTEGSGSSSSPGLLSSPQARDYKGRPADGFNANCLVRDVEDLLPTPRATDGTKGGPNQRGSSGDMMLPSAVHLLPTPTAADGNGGGRGNSAGHQSTLPGTVRLLPTPTATPYGNNQS